MKIETKFNPGDTVYYLGDGKIECKLVEKVNITISRSYRSNYGYKDDIVISYDIGDKRVCFEDKLFATKQELIESL
ncbi:MAG: hypothetical protein HUK14_06130 [Muribaculaceae bacterium]|nr:hypothetical protein [Muribaculaceae bacterium]